MIHWLVKPQLLSVKVLWALLGKLLVDVSIDAECLFSRFIEFAKPSKSGESPLDSWLDAVCLVMAWVFASVFFQSLSLLSFLNLFFPKILWVFFFFFSYSSSFLSPPLNSAFFDWSHMGDYPEEAYVASFLNDPFIRSKLGIDPKGAGDKHDGVFVGCSKKVFGNFAKSGDGARDSTWAVRNILEKGVRV